MFPRLLLALDLCCGISLGPAVKEPQHLRGFTASPTPHFIPPPALEVPCWNVNLMLPVLGSLLFLFLCCSILLHLTAVITSSCCIFFFMAMTCSLSTHPQLPSWPPIAPALLQFPLSSCLQHAWEVPQPLCVQVANTACKNNSSCCFSVTFCPFQAIS